MPKKLEKMVKAIERSGKSEKAAYAIAVSKTGIHRKKGGGWTKGK